MDSPVARSTTNCVTRFVPFHRYVRRIQCVPGDLLRLSDKLRFTLVKGDRISVSHKDNFYEIKVNSSSTIEVSA